MSSILKALQKLEQEKTTRPDRSVDVAKGIVAGGRGPARRPVWQVPAGMAGVAVLAVLVTYTLMGGFDSRQPTVSPPPAPASSSPAQPAVPVTSLPTTAIQEQGIPAAPLPSTLESIAAVTPARSAIPTAAPRQTAPAQPAAALTAAQPEPVEPAQKAAPPHTAEGSQLPAISVSGIAWQKDNSARLAVVNGASVAEGNTVEGARVDEIFPDRVRFSYRKESFEVSLGKGTR